MPTLPLKVPDFTPLQSLEPSKRFEGVCVDSSDQLRWVTSRTLILPTLVDVPPSFLYSRLKYSVDMSK